MLIQFSHFTLLYILGSCRLDRLLLDSETILFPVLAGVEPEPFQLGEHLVEASGKLIVIDQLLDYLQQLGHKVLIFSQMTRFLDILQDYLSYRSLSNYATATLNTLCGLEFLVLLCYCCYFYLVNQCFSYS